MEHRSKLLRTENLLVIMQLHGAEPQRDRNACQSNQHSVLCNETFAVSGQDVFQIPDRKRPGISFRTERTNSPAGILCHFREKSRNTHKIKSYH